MAFENRNIEPAIHALGAQHARVTCDKYGKPVASGFTVAAGSDGRARISCTTPAPDLLDPDRTSDDEMAAERHRMVDAYATTLTEAGWRVDRRGHHSRHPYLLAGRP